MRSRSTPGRARRTALTAAAGAAAVAGTRKAVRSQVWNFARMGGWSIAGPSAAGWATDFLNAAYFRRRPDVRDIDDLRLAFCVLTTYWHRLGNRPLRAPDVAAFHRAFGVDRFWDNAASPRGTMDRGQLLAGAARLLGPWFPEAYHDRALRGWGITFESLEERAAYRPEQRLRHARLGPLTPPVAEGRQQTWHTYAPVAIPDADAAVAALSQPETWPDYASQMGRFTPLRTGGLAGQTFEIEVVGHPTARTPVFLRAYVTVTRVATRTDAAALDAYVAELNDGLLRLGRDEPPAVPEGAEPVLGVDLTTHDGHFLGSARNRVVAYVLHGQAYLRAAGTWDPLRWDLAQLYQRVGYAAQHAMWGAGTAEQSMLHQVGFALEQGARL